MKTPAAIAITSLILWAQPLLTLGMPLAANDLRIAAAANLAPVLETLITQFNAKREKPLKIEFMLASSSALAAQIQSGAPYDLFLSADMARPTLLYEADLTTAPPRAWAFGEICVASRHPLTAALGNGPLSVLEQAVFKTIVIANPELAPYGYASVQAIRASGLYEQLSPRFILVGTIAQTGRHVASGAVDAGFVSMSAILADPLLTQAHWIEVPQELYDPIEQGAVILSAASSSHKEAAAAFLQFLLSEQGSSILRAAGYGTP
jgi:molybdate transport system substrate-binding protein